VKATVSPGLMPERSTDGAVPKSIVMAGQPSAGIGPWVRLIVCLPASTALTLPVVPAAPEGAGMAESWAWPFICICARANVGATVTKVNRARVSAEM